VAKKLLKLHSTIGIEEMKILKFTLQLQQRQVIEMPIGAEIIALIMQSANLGKRG
jgi:hypothetical protein